MSAVWDRTTDDVVIEHFDVTWQAPQDVDRGRLDGLVELLLDGPLEDALVAAGVGANEQVCLREVQVPSHRVRWEQTDAEVVAGWSREIGDAVGAATRAGAADDVLVRYSSLADAVTDLVRRTVVGDVGRIWAWRQLGLWPSDSDSASGGGGENDELARVLRDHLALLPALASTLARTGLLGRLVEHTGPECFAELASDAWAAMAGSRHEVPARVEMRPRDLAAAASMIARSGIVAELAGGGLRAATGIGPRIDRWTWGLLIVMETEPSLAAAGSASAPVVAAVVRSIDGITAQAQPRSLEGIDASADRGGGERRRDELAIEAVASDSDPTSVASAVEVTASADVEHGISTDGDHADGVDERSEPAPSGEPVPAATTRWGGLVFLLHLIDGARLAGLVSTHDELSALGSRSVLHAIGVALLERALPDAPPPDVDDAALLAFAGLAPDADAPELPSDEASLRAVRTLIEAEVDALVERLRDRLHPGDLARSPEPALLLGVARRRATVHADPGWIEVRLELDEVVVDVRRVGLDLDPGYLPWLGVVMRFTYG